MIEYVYDVIVRARDGTGAIVAQYYSTESVSTDGSNTVAANVYMDGTVEQPGVLALHLYGEGATRGSRDVNHGAAVFNNAGGTHDSWTSAAFDGCVYEVWRTPRDTHVSGTGTSKVFLGALEQAAVDEDKATLYVRDMMYLMDRPVLTTRYAGTNVLPAGREGTATDIKGNIKPMPLGKVLNVTPPCVNTSRPLYQLSVSQLETGFSVVVYVNRTVYPVGISRTMTEMDGSPVQPFDYFARDLLWAGPPTEAYGSYDAAGNLTTHGFTTGTPIILQNRVVGATTYTFPSGLTVNTYYFVRVIDTQHFILFPTAADAAANTNQTLFDTFSGAKNNGVWAFKNKTPANQYDWCNDATEGFFIRPGQDTTARQVTCDITNPIFTNNSATPANLTTRCQPHELLQRLLRMGTGGAVAVAATLSTYPDTGVWIEDDMTFLDAANEVAGAVCAGYYFVSGSSSSVEMRQLLDPSTGTATASFDTTNIIDRTMIRLASADDDKGVPAWRVNLNYQRNHTVQTNADLAGVALSDVGFTEREYRTIIVEDTSVKTQWPYAPEITINTSIDSASAASTEATRLLNLYKVHRDVFSMEVPVKDTLSLFLGCVVLVTYPRFSLGAGKKFQLLGMTSNFDRNTVTITVWG